jgi:primosomal protein N''
MSNNNKSLSQYIEKCRSTLVVIEEYTERSSNPFQHLKECISQSVGSKKVLSSTKSKETESV